MSKKKLCVFVHYSRCLYIPNYVKLFVDELCHYFDEIILIQNKRPLRNAFVVSENPKVRRIATKNEGYDMGMFYKAIQTVNLENYSQIACINDSNILFNRLAPLFAWGEEKKHDFWGTVDSFQKPKNSTLEETYHIQSHFLVFNEKAILLLPEYFRSVDMQAIYNEKDEKVLRDRVIEEWEIGLSQFFLKKGVSMGSYFSCKDFPFEHNLNIDIRNTNLSCSHYFRLIQRGYPLLKKRVTYKKNILKLLFRPHLKWDHMILKYGRKEWELKAIIDEVKTINKMA